MARLSGGERGRLSLLRLIKEGHNTLLLDEPTNHLDIRSRESLEAALQDFDGTLIVVSHDRRFLDKLVRRLIIFPSGAAGTDGEPGGRVVQFDGGWEEWVRRRDGAKTAAAAASASRRPTRPARTSAAGTAAAGRVPLSKNEQDRRRRWIAEAEAAILSLESEKEAALARDVQARPGQCPPPGTGAPQHRRSRRELEKHLADWETWSLEIEEGTDPGTI